MAKTVLIVEDNELNMKLFRDLLEAHGYQTSGTSNGFEALDLVRKLRPDLILMDIQLPQVSGLEVTRWIKDDPELRSIPVVAVTAFAMKGDEERIREGGCEAYLSKPISVGKFIETVRRNLLKPSDGLSGRGELRCPRAFWSSTTSPPTSSCWKRGCRPNISTS
jgi:FOG: CheY-like receiver